MRRQERLDLRTRYQKVFATDDPATNVATIGAAPIHYRTPQGEWDDLANLVKEVAGGWVAETDETRVGIENGYLTFTHNGRSLQMRPTAIGMVDATAPATRWRKLADADYSNVTRDGTTITAHDIFPNTDLALTIEEGVISKAFTVRTKPSPPDPVSLGWNPATTYVVIVWDVQKPAGAVVRDTVTLEEVGSGYARKNPLVVETAQGEPVLYFDAGEAVSASGRKGPVWYVCLGAQVPFGEAIPYSRIMATSYPFVIDPTSRIMSTGANQLATLYLNGGPPADVLSYSTAQCGNNYTYDPGNGKDIPPSESGGPARGYARWPLTGIAGTCVSASVIGDVYHGSQAQVYIDRIPNWGTIDSSDWDTTPEASNWGTYNFGPSDAGYTHMQGVANKPGSTVWVRARRNSIEKSSDGGQTWSSLGTTAYTTLQVGHIGGRWFGRAKADNGLWTATDSGAIALVSPIPAYSSYSRLPVWTGSYWVMGTQANSSAGIAYSSDGTTWTSVGASGHGFGGSFTVCIAWDGTYLWGVGRNSPNTAWVTMRTTDPSGSTGWAVVNTTNEAVVAAYDGSQLFWTGSRLIFVGSVDDVAGVYSLEGTTWTARLTGYSLTDGSASLQRNSTYTFLAWRKYLWRSTDGVSWTSITTGDPWFSYSYGGSVGVADDGTVLTPEYTVMGYATSCIYMRSSDHGSTWEVVQEATPITFPASDVQAKFGSTLAVRFRGSDENDPNALDMSSLGQQSYLEIEYTNDFAWDGPGITLDAVVRKTQAGSLTANAVIRKGQAGSLTASATVRKTASAALTANAAIRGTTASSLTTDAIVARTATAAFLADAVTQQGYAGSFTANAFLAAHFTADAWISGSNPYFTADAAILGPRAGSFSADAIVSQSGAGSLTANAVLRRTQSGTSAADAVVRREIASGRSLDAIVRRTSQASLTTDAIIARQGSDSFAAQAWVEQSGVSLLTADAVISRVASSSFTAAAEIIVSEVERTGSLTADSVIRKAATATFTADAAASQHVAASLTTDAIIAAVRNGALAANATVRLTQTGSLAADALIASRPSGSFTVSALVLGTGFGTLTAGAILRASRESAFAASAFITKTVTTTLPADAVALAARMDGIATSAVARSLRQSSFTAGAFGSLASSGSFTADASVVLLGGSGFTADAAISAAPSGSFTAAAVVNDLRIGAAEATITFSHAMAAISSDHAESEIDQRHAAATLGWTGQYRSSFTAEAVIT